MRFPLARPRRDLRDPLALCLPTLGGVHGQVEQCDLLRQGLVQDRRLDVRRQRRQIDDAADVAAINLLLVDRAGLQQRRAACGRRYRAVLGLRQYSGPDGPGARAVARGFGVARPFGTGAVRINGAVRFWRDAAGGDRLALGGIRQRSYHRAA